MTRTRRATLWRSCKAVRRCRTATTTWKKTSATKKLSWHLTNYVNKLFELSGQATDQVGADILALETKLAEVQWPRVELRDANKRYNLHSFAELKEMGENISAVDFFPAAGISRSRRCQCHDAQLLSRAWMRWWLPRRSRRGRNIFATRCSIRQHPVCHGEFVQAHFDFHERNWPAYPS